MGRCWSVSQHCELYKMRTLWLDLRVQSANLVSQHRSHAGRTSGNLNAPFCALERRSAIAPSDNDVETPCSNALVTLVWDGEKN